MKKPLLLTLLLFITTFTAFSQFITTWKTDNAGTSLSDQIQLPIYGDGYEIYWWLKSDSTEVNGTAVASGYNYTLTLPQPGIYGLSISKGTGTLNNFSFNNAGDKLKLMEINQWGNQAWTSMANAFNGCSNLTISAIDRPNLMQVSNMSGMFQACSKIEQIPDMENWDVSTVTNMAEMFNRASSFNQPLNEWVVSNVTSMYAMFYKATSFNQSLSEWDVGNVRNMSTLFYDASKFDQPLDKWDVSNVTNMYAMFYGATSFNQPLSQWEVSNVTNMGFMLNSSGIDCANITHTLRGWAANPLTPNNIALGAYGINYAAEANDALNILRTQKGWSIHIGSEVACQQLPVTFVHFKAVQQEDGVRLDWATSLEQDHNYFEVQRSVDSKNWLPLTRIQGSGNGNALHDYAYVDIHPLQATSYYRLKMVDLDGTIAYSTIRSVNRGNISTVKVYPNPTNTSVTLSGLPKGMLKIYNRLGVMVGQQYIAPQETTFSVEQLPAGTYILKMDHGWQHQLVKVY